MEVFWPVLNPHKTLLRSISINYLPILGNSPSLYATILEFTNPVSLDTSRTVCEKKMGSGAMAADGRQQNNKLASGMLANLITFRSNQTGNGGPSDQTLQRKPRQRTLRSDGHLRQTHDIPCSPRPQRLRKG